MPQGGEGQSLGPREVCPQREGATPVNRLGSSGLPGFILRKRLLSFLLWLLSPPGLCPGAGHVPVVRPLASVQSPRCGTLAAGALCTQALEVGLQQSQGGWPMSRMTRRCPG